MGRILAIDLGLKRCGLAWTDPLRIIACGLPTVAAADLDEALAKIIASETIDEVVLGKPSRLDGQDTHMSNPVRQFKKKFETQYPEIKVNLWDERFTSVMAKQAILQSGVNRKKRQDKSLVDQVSATIILQSFMDRL